MRNNGAFIAFLRQEKGLSRKQLAELVGVKERVLKRWETGKRAVDIGVLPELSKVLGASVEELMNGGRSAQPQADDAGTVEKICHYAGPLLKGARIRAWLSFAVLAFILGRMVIGDVLLFAGSLLCPKEDGICVVASDHSSLTFLGERYVPLALDGVECELGQHIQEDVQTEDRSWYQGMMLDVSLYAVRNVPAYDLVYLLNGAESGYYVRETEAARYEELIGQSRYDQYHASFRLDSGYLVDVPLSYRLGDALQAFPLQEPLGPYEYQWDGWLDIRAYEQEGIFYLPVGHFEASEDTFLWVPDEYIPAGDQGPGYYASGSSCYMVDPSLHEELRVYFDMIQR